MPDPWHIAHFVDTAFDLIVDALRGDAATASAGGTMVLPTEADAGGIAPAVAVLGNCAWHFLVTHASEALMAGMSRVANRYFSAVYRLEQALIMTASEAASGTITDLELRSNAAEALIAGTPLTDPELIEELKIGAYVVMSVGAVDEAEVWGSLMRFAELPRWRRTLPAIGTYGITLILPIQGIDPSQDQVKVAREALADLRLAEEPATGVAFAPAAKAVPGATGEARMIMNVTRSLGQSTGPHILEDVCVEVLLVRSPDLAERLARRLQPLAAREGYLLDTLRTYMSSDRRRTETAAQLHIHPNTLDYRLRRVHSLTGLSTASARDARTLSVSLAAWQMHGADGQSQPG